MNKKQLIVAWVMGVLILLVCLYTPVRTKMDINNPNAILERVFIFDIHIGTIDMNLLTVEIIPILVMGGLLIYTLKDKKK